MVLHLRRSAPDAWRSAKCLGTVGVGTPDPFFHVEGEPFREEEAIEICRGGTPCAIIHECLLFALVNNERGGVWGGHGEADRKAMRQKWPMHRGKAPRPEWEVFEVGKPASWYEGTDLNKDD